MTELLSQYPPKTKFLKNENNLISAKKPHRSKMKLYFSKKFISLYFSKKKETKNQLISTLIPTQLLTQNQSLRK